MPKTRQRKCQCGDKLNSKYVLYKSCASQVNLSCIKNVEVFLL